VTKTNVGRNDPCPCGSGKKYKKCCLERDQADRLKNRAANVLDELHEALDEQQFASFTQAQTFVNGFMEKHNRGPRDDFHGLSPDQMHRFLHFPFDSPDLVVFPDRFDPAPTAPILTLLGLLAQGIGGQGMKPTAKGNLPQKFCREAALHYWGEETYRRNTRFAGINREEDFAEMHVARLTAQLGGLVRKYKGRFILGRDCRNLLFKDGSAAIYPRLFQSYTTRFNWGYRDRYPQIPFIQQSFLFSLYLLSRYGSEPRPHSFYEDCFLQAFPMVLNDLEPASFSTPEQRIRSCYTVRTLIRFAEFFGLATVEPFDAEKLFPSKYRVRKSPLLDQAVRFHVKV